MGDHLIRRKVERKWKEGEGEKEKKKGRKERKEKDRTEEEDEGNEWHDRHLVSEWIMASSCKVTWGEMFSLSLSLFSLFSIFSNFLSMDWRRQYNNITLTFLFRFIPLKFTFFNELMMIAIKVLWFDSLLLVVRVHSSRELSFHKTFWKIPPSNPFFLMSAMKSPLYPPQRTKEIRKRIEKIRGRERKKLRKKEKDQGEDCLMWFEARSLET